MALRLPSVAKEINEMRVKHQCNIPWLILMDPTSACNLHCTGCWAAEYGNRLNLSFEDMDRIVTQGKELGIYLYFSPVANLWCVRTISSVYVRSMMTVASMHLPTAP